MSNDITARKHGGADTSVQAFDGTPPAHRDRQRENVLRFIGQMGASGATTWECSLAVRIPYTGASARISELLKADRVHDSGQRRKTGNGRTARVIVAGPRPTNVIQLPLFLGGTDRVL